MSVVELDAGVLRWSDGDDVVLWHGQTGRHVRIAAASWEEALQLGDRAASGVRTRLVREHLLAESPAQADKMVVARNRRVLWLPDEPALWMPAPDRPTSGGFAYVRRKLDAAELLVWEAINDRRTLMQVAEAAGAPLVFARAFLRELCAPGVQATQLRDAPPAARDPGLERLVAPPRPDATRTADQRGTAGETDLRDYHLRGITDGRTHFDDRETTLAHALALPHPGLGGRRYGEALCDALDKMGLLRVAGPLVEVGCGTGELAAAFALRLGDRGPRPYLRVDLSPELLRTQARNAPGTVGVLADALWLPFRDAAVACVVSNEVLADLSAVPWSPGETGGPQSEVADRVARYGLTPLAGRGPYNLGSWRFVEEVARVLLPGGSAVLTEFGTLDEAPEEAVQLDHPEVSIHFGHLAEIGRKLGLSAEVLPLPDLLGLDRSATWMTRGSWEAARALARSLGVHLQARAWTAASWDAESPLPVRVEGLRFGPLSDPGPGPTPDRFLALVLRKV